MATRPPSVPIDDDDVQRQKLAQAIVPASSKKINAVRPLPQQRTMQRPEQRPRSMRRKLGKGSQRGSNRKKTKGVSNTSEDGPSNNAIINRHPTAFEVISSISDIHSGWPIEDITIRNRSYYYRNNRLFGVERMRFQSVQFNKHSGQWEARYFNVLPFATTKEATRAKFDPKYKEGPYDENKLHALEIKLPTTKTERAARKLVRKAMAERDAPPKVKYGVSNDKIDPVTHLQTHFTLKVVSTKFAGKDLFERFAIIYRALLDLLEVDQGADVDVRTQWKGYGMVGPKVRSLPQYRYMREEVVLMALTPHQWKPKKYSHHPNEHKYGRSRLEPSEVDDKAVVLQSSKFERLMQMENKCKAPDPHKRNQTSTKKKYGAVQKKKKADRDQGGFLDNFGVAIYAAMKEEKERKKVRRKEAEQTQDKNTSSTMVNRLLHLINKSSSRSPDQRKSRNKPTAGKGNKARSKDQQPKSDSQEIAVVPEADIHASRSLGIDRPHSATVPHTAKRQSRPTSPSVMRSRPNSPSTVRSRPNSANLRKSRPNSPTARQSSTAFGPTAETGVTPEQQMKDILESVRFSVRSLQRLYRQRLRRRFLRWWFRVHHLATLISRFYRGYCARVYVHSFRKVRSEACVVIQSVWRGHYSRQWTRKFRAQRLRALSVLQPVMSAWLLRQRLSFAAKNRLSATHIQRLVRGHFGRTRTIQVLGMRYFCAVLVPASTRCQALFRGHRDRTFIRNVVLPSSRHRLSTHRAILSSQKRLRGLWSRRRTAKLRERVAAAQRVQAVFHGWRARVLARALRLRRKRNHNASIIQRIGRGFIAREFARELRDIRYHKTVRIPASITVQKVYRSYAVRERARKALIEWNAAQKMVTFWRFCKAMIVFHKRWLEHLEERRFHLAALFQKIVRGYQARQYANTLRRTQHGDRVKAVFPLQNAWRKFAARRTMERQRVVAEDHWSKKCLAETDEDIQHYSGKIRRLQQRVANAVRARKVVLFVYHKRRIAWPSLHLFVYACW